MTNVKFRITHTGWHYSMTYTIFIPIKPFSEPACSVDGGIVILVLGLIYSGFSFNFLYIAIEAS